MENPLDILCLNCQEMINYHKISVHSALCVYPPDLIISLESKPWLYINHRLERLKSTLENILLIRCPKEAFPYKYLLNKTIKLLLISEPHSDSVETCNEITLALKKFSKSMIHPGLIIYSERLKQLSGEKTVLLIESLAANGFSEDIVKLLTKKYSEILKIRLEASGVPNERRILKGLSENLQNIDEIASQVSKVMTQRSSTSSFMSPDGDQPNECDINDIDKMYLISTKEQTQNTEKDLQKYFYSQCLAIKIKYNSSRPLRVHDLYKKAKQLNLPMKEWEKFIRTELNCPGN